MNSNSNNLKLMVCYLYNIQFFKFNRMKIMLDTKRFYANIMQVAWVVVMERDANLPMGKKN